MHDCGIKGKSIKFCLYMCVCVYSTKIGLILVLVLRYRKEGCIAYEAREREAEKQIHN